VVRVEANVRRQTLTVLSSPALGQPAAIVEVGFVPDAQQQHDADFTSTSLKRWALVMPNTPTGTQVPLLPHRRSGATASTLYHNQLSTVSWSQCTSPGSDDVLPGMSRAVYHAILRSPCASARWWMATGARATDHTFAAAQGGGQQLPVPPVMLEGCPYPITPLPATAVHRASGSGVQCGRCQSPYATMRAFQSACAPDTIAHD